MSTPDITLTSAPLIYFSSKTENTHKVAVKTRLASCRLPIRAQEANVRAQKPFILMTPCYADSSGKGAVPKSVISFLNDPVNRHLIRGVIASGNRNFGSTFALAGDVISQKCNVPVLYRFELAGTEIDIQNIRRGIPLFLHQPET